MKAQTTSLYKDIFKSERIVLYLLTFVMGGCGIAYEYTLSKISSDLMGNSVAQWAIIIGLMMFCMGIGSDLQKYFSDKKLLEKFILFELLQGLLGGFGPLILFHTFGVYRDYFKLVQFLFLIVIGIIIGFEIPILSRINERYTKELKVNIGGILRMDYIGAFVGAVFWLFILLPFFSLLQIGFVLGGLNIFVSSLTFFYFRRASRNKVFNAILILVCLGSLVFGFIKAPDWSKFSEQNLYLDKIIYSKTTNYQHIVLTRHRSGDIYCYINGNLQFSSLDEYIYHEFLVHPAMKAAESRERVLVLGGGDGLALREVLKYPDVREVTLVDIDPEMTAIARENPILRELNKDSLRDARVKVLENKAIREGDKYVIGEEDRTDFGSRERLPAAEVSLIHMDAASFVEQASGLYDVIIADFPDPNSAELAKLYSRGFYRHIRSKLSRFGIFVTQSTSPFHAKEAFLCIGRTAVSAGLRMHPYHGNVPSFGEWGWWIGGRSESFSETELRQCLDGTGVADIPVETRYLSKELIGASLLFGKDGLRSEEKTINTIFNNAVYKYYEEAARKMR